MNINIKYVCISEIVANWHPDIRYRTSSLLDKGKKATQLQELYALLCHHILILRKLHAARLYHEHPDCNFAF